MADTRAQRIQVAKLAFKAAFLSPSTPTPAGQVSPAERWCEVMMTPLAREAVERTFGEYASSLTPDLQAPGVAAWKLVGAREALNLLLTLGEPVKPTIAPSVGPQLTPV